MLKAVLFDMDGVIVDTEPLHRKAYHHMFDDVKITVDEDLYASFTGQSTINICKRLVSYFNIDKAPEDLVSLKRKYYKHFFDNDDLGLIEGVLDRIQDYCSNNVTLVVASSASMQGINQIFERFDLNQYFSSKLSGADLQKSKPHPEIFLKAAQSTGFDKSQCIVIEDSTNGIKAAHSAGIYCIGFKSPHSSHQDYSLANKIISDFKEISYTEIANIV